MYKICVCLLGLVAALATGTVEAGTIHYEYSTKLSLSSGTDIAGLDGATATVNVSVDSSSVYIDSFGYPAVVMNDDATVTIAGSSQAANNGTFQIPLYAFYPTFAGLYLYPYGIDSQLDLSVGGSISLSLGTYPSLAGAVVEIGDTVSLDDFTPADSTFSTWSSSAAVYNQVDPTVTAFVTIVPEPSSVAMFGLGGIGLAIVGRKRRVA